MTRDQQAELLAIGGTVLGANRVATTGGAGVWLDTPAQRVLRALGHIEVVEGPAIFKRARKFVKLTDKGIAAYLGLVAGIVSAEIKQKFALGGFPMACLDTCTTPAACLMDGCAKSNNGDNSNSPGRAGQKGKPANANEK